MKFTRYFATVLILLAGLALAACNDEEVESAALATPGITVTPTTGLITTEFGGTATFNVVLNTQPTADVFVTLSSSTPSEGTVVTVSPLVFTSVNGTIAQPVTIMGADDAGADGPVPYTVITAPAVSADLGYNGLDPADVTVTNIDNDIPINPSFEFGNLTGWITQDLATPFFPILVAAAGFPLPFSGNPTIPTHGGFALVHGFDGSGPGFIRLMQDVGIPIAATNLFFDWRAGWGMGGTLNRTFVVRIEPPGGGPALQPVTMILTAVAGTTNIDTGPNSAIVNVSAFAGTVVRIVLEWSVPENFTGPAEFQVDNFFFL